MKKIKCDYCNRIIPDKNHLTTNEYVWCDGQSHLNKLKEKKK